MMTNQSQPTTRRLSFLPSDIFSLILCLYFSLGKQGIWFTKIILVNCYMGLLYDKHVDVGIVFWKDFILYVNKYNLIIQSARYQNLCIRHLCGHLNGNEFEERLIPTVMKHQNPNDMSPEDTFRLPITMLHLVDIYSNLLSKYVEDAMHLVEPC